MIAAAAPCPTCSAPMIGGVEQNANGKHFSFYYCAGCHNSRAIHDFTLSRESASTGPHGHLPTVQTRPGASALGPLEDAPVGLCSSASREAFGE